MSIVTIAENDRKERFIATAGQTVFPYDFPIYAAADLQVRRERAGAITLLTLGTDYSVTGVQNQTGGNVVLATGANAGDIIVILSAMSTARATQFVNGGDLAAAALEAELNRIRILFQQNARDGRNALLFPPTDPAMQDLPPIALRANRFLAFDVNGQPIAAAPVAGTVLDAISRLGDNMAGRFGFTPGNAASPGIGPSNDNTIGFFSGPNFLGVTINGQEVERFIPGGMRLRPQTVTVFPPVAGVARILKPDGSWLNATTSTTSGIQEAINFACGNGTAGNGSLDLHIVGGEELGATPGGAVVYTCTTPLAFPPMQGKRITSGAITLFFTSAIGSQSAVRFDSCMMVDVNLAGAQIVNNGTGRALEFSPQNNLPLDGALFGVKAIIDSRFLITTVVNINNATQAAGNGACVWFNPAASGGTGINNNHFEFGEINQENTAANTAGIWISNAAANQPFANNLIKCLHVHNHKGVGIQIGTSAALTNYGNNYYYLVLNSAAGATEDCNTFGFDDILFISSETLNQQYGLRLQSSATKNLIISNRLSGSVGAISNNATNKTSNRWLRAGAMVRSAITLTGSPFTYQNTDLSEQTIIIQGGALSAETQFSVDGTAFYNTGMSSGLFTLPPGAYLRVFYTAAPQMNLFKP